MKLTDLLPAEKWAELEDELTGRFGLQATAYNPEGLGVTGRHVFVNRLCETLKGSPLALSTICATANQNFMAEAKSTGVAVISECDAGLVKLAVPVMANGEFLGTVGGCGLLPQGGEAEEFLIGKTTGLPDGEVAELCAGIGEAGESLLWEMAGFIEKRLAEIIHRAGATVGSGQTAV